MCGREKEGENRFEAERHARPKDKWWLGRKSNFRREVGVEEKRPVIMST
jgi:hypothetical protein